MTTKPSTKENNDKALAEQAAKDQTSTETVTKSDGTAKNDDAAKKDAAKNDDATKSDAATKSDDTAEGASGRRRTKDESERAVSHFAAHDLRCLQKDCPNKAADGPLTLWGEAPEPLGLRCEACETVWPTLEVYLSRRNRKSNLRSGFLLSGAALISVWFLAWPLAAQAVISILCGLAFLQSSYRLWQSWRRHQAYALLAHQLGLPAGPQETTSLKDLPKHIEEHPSLKRQNELRRQLLAFLAAYQRFSHEGLPQMRYALWSRKRYPLQGTTHHVKRADLKATERSWAEARLAWMQTLEAQRESYEQGLEDCRRFVQALDDLLEDLRLSQSEEAQEILLSLETMLRECNRGLEQLRTLYTQALHP